MKIEINNIDEFIKKIEAETEWLETTEGDEVECISIENLKGLLNKYEVNN